VDRYHSLPDHRWIDTTHSRITGGQIPLTPGSPVDKDTTHRGGERGEGRGGLRGQERRRG